MIKCSESIAKTTMSTNRHAIHRQGYNDETHDPFSPMSPAGQDEFLMLGCDSSSNKLTADDISGMESGDDGRRTVQVWSGEFPEMVVNEDSSAVVTDGDYNSWLSEVLDQPLESETEPEDSPMSWLLDPPPPPDIPPHPKQHRGEQDEEQKCEQTFLGILPGGGGANLANQADYQECQIIDNVLHVAAAAENRDASQPCDSHGRPESSVATMQQQATDAELESYSQFLNSSSDDLLPPPPSLPPLSPSAPQLFQATGPASNQGRRGVSKPRAGKNAAAGRLQLNLMKQNVSQSAGRAQGDQNVQRSDHAFADHRSSSMPALTYKDWSDQRVTSPSTGKEMKLGPGFMGKVAVLPSEVQALFTDITSENPTRTWTPRRSLDGTSSTSAATRRSPSSSRSAGRSPNLASTASRAAAAAASRIQTGASPPPLRTLSDQLVVDIGRFSSRNNFARQQQGRRQ